MPFGYQVEIVGHGVTGSIRCGRGKPLVLLVRAVENAYAVRAFYNQVIPDIFGHGSHCSTVLTVYSDHETPRSVTVTWGEGSRDHGEESDPVENRNLSQRCLDAHRRRPIWLRRRKAGYWRGRGSHLDGGGLQGRQSRNALFDDVVFAVRPLRGQCDIRSGALAIRTCRVRGPWIGRIRAPVDRAVESTPFILWSHFLRG